ncbi:hypothetical protein BUALT_Bualt11G0041400 [Buddleja alternifolia]|uniref:SAC domain-containing protein n=1 Tax=Buddleja alternifolia TaxID=168488 RepID=A0AAV6WYQ9_9LAMI|nr:hypothetical protein BUALT_Bualt11G0041400 [Buddleja alternifolia]
MDNHLAKVLTDQMVQGNKCDGDTWKPQALQSGFTWDEERKMIVVTSDEWSAWTTYFESHPDAKGLHNKTIDNWDDIVLLCGKDRATGQGAENFEDGAAAMGEEEENEFVASKKKKEEKPNGIEIHEVVSKIPGFISNELFTVVYKLMNGDVEEYKLLKDLPDEKKRDWASDFINHARKLYNKMRLWEFPDQYVVEPTDGSSASFLAISRLDGSMNLIEDIPQCDSLRVPKIVTIYGVVGMLKLLAGKFFRYSRGERSVDFFETERVRYTVRRSYLLVITERECVGSYLGYPIFKIISLKVFPCDHSVDNSPQEQKKMESEFSRLLSVAERTPGLYFSYDVNITLSAQRLHDLGDESKLLPLWRQFSDIKFPLSKFFPQADPRFLWNNYMLEVLIDHKLDPYLLPVMQGSFQSFQAAIGKDILDVALIARRCTRRTGTIVLILHVSEGTRMWRRGADSDGFVANFVETEQIIQLKGYTASFVQVRGSIPLLWDQIVDLTYKPKFEIVRPEEAPRVVERHFLDLRKKYGNVLAVDLVNKHGGEGRLCERFGNAMEHLDSDDVRYLHFDFHKICGQVHFERLSILYDQIEDFLIKNRYLLLNEKGEKVEGQVGIVRTNCIDCLDRTNVTQDLRLLILFDLNNNTKHSLLVAFLMRLFIDGISFLDLLESMIARKMLEFQLRRLGVFSAEETISAHPNFDESFRIQFEVLKSSWAYSSHPFGYLHITFSVWANHGDDVSMQYSGTPALKGDFVRCGQRTIQGILKDGWSALMRYYLNNFCDGTKQDAIDLLQGHYILSVSRSMAPAAQKGGIEAVASFPLALSLIMTGFFFATLSLRRVRYDWWNLLFSLMWASMSLVIAAFVKANGRVFCNRPRLHQPRC